MSDPRRMSATVGPTADSADGDRLRGRQVPEGLPSPHRRLSSLTTAPYPVQVAVRVAIIVFWVAVLASCAGFLSDGPR